MGATAAIAMFAGSAISAGSQLAAGEHNAKALKYNAKIARMQADDALFRGEEDVMRAQRKGAQVRGAQRVALAAQGVDVNQDTAALVQKDTARAVAEDVATIRNNARREAWGYRVQATNLKSQARMSRYEGRSGAAGTLLGGGGQSYFAGKSAGAW
jgi:hypothetical protein